MRTPKLQFANSETALEVREGLTKPSKSLPAKLFYDAAGSELFEQITLLREYYLTRTERAILKENAGAMVELAGNNLTLIELGAGTASKTQTIIRALIGRQLRVTFCPIDVSPTALKAAGERIKNGFDQVKLCPIVGDYVHGMAELRKLPGRKLVLFIGSSIGNFEPHESAELLRALRKAVRPGDALLLGTDLVKDLSILLPAYNDPCGITAAFNKNVLARINRELGGHFDLDAFRHVAPWNRKESRMEMHLESLCQQDVLIEGLKLTVHFDEGERIHTENSYKYTVPRVRSLAKLSGFRIEQSWSDPRKWFAVHLARAV